MGCSCTPAQCCCHTLGIICTFLGAVGLLGGLILLCIFDKGTLYYWIAIGGLCGGALFAILLIIYACVINRQDLKLYGCIGIKVPHKKLVKTLQMMPSKEDVEGGSEVNGHVNKARDDDDLDLDNNRNSKTSLGLDWDPDTVLPD